MTEYIHTCIHTYLLHFTRSSCGRSSSVNHLNKLKLHPPPVLLQKTHESSLMSGVLSDAVPAVNKYPRSIKRLFTYCANSSKFCPIRAIVGMSWVLRAMAHPSCHRTCGRPMLRETHIYIYIYV